MHSYQEYKEHMDMEFEREQQAQQDHINSLNEQFNIAESNNMKRLAPIVATQAERDCLHYVNRNFERIMLGRGMTEQEAKEEAKKQYIWII